MEVHTEAAGHTFEADPSILKADSGKHPETEGIESSPAAEAWKPGLLASLHASKKCLIRVVNTLEGPSLHIDWDGSGVRIALPPFSKRPRLVYVRSRYPLLPMGVYAFLEGGVIELTLSFEDSLERTMLASAG